MFLGENRTNLFSLEVIQKPAQSNKDHHIVAHGSAGYELSGKRGGSSCDKRTALVAASSRTHMDGLANFELTVGYGLAVMVRRLLHLHRSTAEGTSSGGFPHIDVYTHGAQHFLLNANL
jgi:hypothetical protein